MVIDVQGSQAALLVEAFLQDDAEDTESNSSDSSVKGGAIASISKGSASKSGGGKRKEAMDHLLELLDLSHQQQKVEDEVCMIFTCVCMSCVCLLHVCMQ